MFASASYPRYNKDRRYFVMLKKLSLATVILSGILLVGCSQQSSPAITSKTETTQKSTKKTKSTVSKSSEINKDQSEPADETNTTTETSTAEPPLTDDPSGKNGTETYTSLTTEDLATVYLADHLANVYDRTTTQYVVMGKRIWNDQEGFQINIYSKNEEAPIASYFVPADGQFVQIW